MEHLMEEMDTRELNQKRMMKSQKTFITVDGEKVESAQDLNMSP